MSSCASSSRQALSPSWAARSVDPTMSVKRTVARTRSLSTGRRTPVRNCSISSAACGSALFGGLCPLIVRPANDARCRRNQHERANEVWMRRREEHRQGTALGNRDHRRLISACRLEHERHAAWWPVIVRWSRGQSMAGFSAGRSAVGGFTSPASARAVRCAAIWRTRSRCVLGSRVPVESAAACRASAAARSRSCCCAFIAARVRCEFMKCAPSICAVRPMRPAANNLWAPLAAFHVI